MMNQEGVIKFHNQWVDGQLEDFELFDSLNEWRNRLHELYLIGVNEQGIGYGNISIRFNTNQFIISGSGTGNLRTLTKQHYTLVTSYSFEDNRVSSRGPISASSESLTHAAIYASDEKVNAVIHVHHRELWNQCLYILPASGSDIEYGTPGMANEVERLFKQTDLAVQKIMIMGGHPDGILTFGCSLDEAGHRLLELFNKM
jgi:ribulose-5-phosphate 4-epimerase/fuculose-1-phosphate aldolase